MSRALPAGVFGFREAGDRVRLQGVTLGAKSFTIDSGGRVVKGFARQPILEDDVLLSLEAR